MFTFKSFVPNKNVYNIFTKKYKQITLIYLIKTIKKGLFETTRQVSLPPPQLVRWLAHRGTRVVAPRVAVNGERFRESKAPTTMSLSIWVGLSRHDGSFGSNKFKTEINSQ